MTKSLQKFIFSSTIALLISSISLSADFVIPTDPTTPINCNFNGAVVTDGASITAFQNSTVGFGNSCVSETRLCTNGILSGSYTFASCSVGAAASCLFNGATINHGDSVTGYTSSTVAFNQVCSSVAETRTCNNGALSGSATFASCNTSAARSCLFDGKTILSGDSITGYQTSTSQFGGSCTSESRVCTDGTLSGSFAFGSCTVDQQASCLLNGRTLAHGEVAVAFQSSTANFGASCTQENRTCNNGVLSGSYLFDSCSVNTPASCSLNGSTILSGSSVIAFASANVNFGQVCHSQVRSCSNGVLSGSFSNSACAVAAAADCTLNGKTISHGASVTMFTAANVPNGQTCQSEIRSCSNGNLSGAAVYESCLVQPPVIIIDPPPSCVLNGKVYPSDAVVKMYQSTTVPFGQTCVVESRQCLNGAFTGSFTNTSCSVDAPASCSLNGKTIANGASVTLFTSSSVPPGQVCKSEIRSCTNGVLSGSAVSETCVVQTPPPPPPPPIDPGGGSCPQTSMIWEFPKDCRGQCGPGNGLKKSRISRDGGKKWLVIQNNELPDDLKEVYNYMLKQNGKNSCGRPNVNYTISKNAGYVVLDVKKIPDCKICRFVEVEQEREEHHGLCRHHKENKHKKVLKFMCGEIKKKTHQGDHDDDDRSNDKDHDRYDRSHREHNRH
jgi:hypothetical protein